MEFILWIIESGMDGHDDPEMVRFDGCKTNAMAKLARRCAIVL
jgi:hypothetical protein